MRRSSRSSKRRSFGWRMPVAFAAVVVLALFLFLNLSWQHSDPSLPQQQPLLPILPGSPPLLAGGSGGGRQLRAESSARGAPGADGSQATGAKREKALIPRRQAAGAHQAAAGLAASSAAAEEAAEAAMQRRIRELEGEEDRGDEEAGRASNKRHDVDYFSWPRHVGKSCQNYAKDDATPRSLHDSKVACLANDACVAIECPSGQETLCTLRAVTNFVDYAPADCYEKVDPANQGSRIHPEYTRLIKEYPFKPMLNQNGQMVNIMLVQSPLENSEQRADYERFKNDILFLGISSFEDYPLWSGNPFSGRFSEDTYKGLFPGFLHMMREPQKYFEPHVKTILMSQSDFMLPDVPARDYSIPRKYDFTLSGSDQDVHNDCVGWSSYAKNWSFLKQSLEVMCGEYNLTGVLVATKDKQGRKACTIPKSCKGKMIQTTFLRQDEYFHYLKQSRFAYLPQVHDASPRVSTQALCHDVPLLMNAHISGGWKYLNKKTGEFFHDMTDFRQSLENILRNADIPYRYEPRKYVLENYGNAHAGKRLLKFVKDHFSHRVKLPAGTTQLVPSSR